MEFYTALNHGDASLKEPHLTSILYYIFIETFNKNHISFLDFFIKKYLNKSIEDFEPLDLETDILIEQILSLNNERKDCDITIFLKNKSENLIVNIENKISKNSFQNDQISIQNRLLSEKYPDHKIFNIVILPFESSLNIEDDSIHKIIYWHGKEDSLIKIICLYGESINSQNSDLKPFVDFFVAFGDNLEQQLISMENIERGPRNNYRFTMFEYLNNIAINWDEYFTNRSVKVKELVRVFEEKVFNDIDEMDLTEEEKEQMKLKFQRGARDAQPKIMTVNEKNRVHFGINDNISKALFYYPDYLDGIIDNKKWKERNIKSLRNKLPNENVVVFWKDKDTSDMKFADYEASS